MADLRDERGNPIQLTDEHGNPVQLTDEFGNPMHLTGVATSTAGGTTGLGGGVGHQTHDVYGGGGGGIGTGAGGGIGHQTPDVYGGGGGIGTGAGAGIGHQTPDVYGGGGGGIGTGATTGTTTTHHATPTDYAKRGADAVVGAGGATLGVATGVGKAAGDMVTGHAPGHHVHEEVSKRTHEHQPFQQQHQQVERSVSSPSSSDNEEEDDGQGGRRKKKGLKEKIKEILPGGKHKDKDKEEHAHSFTTKISSTTAPGQPHEPENIRVEHHEHEKKGMIEKIKEKLPGHH